MSGSEFASAALGEKLDDFFRAAVGKGYDAQAKIGKGPSLLKSPKYAGNPEALYKALDVKYPGMEGELVWLKEWKTHIDSEYVERLMEFYKAAAPDNVSRAEVVWASYKKRPRQLLQKLLATYGDAHASNLQWLHTYIESCGPDEIPSNPTASSTRSQPPAPVVPMYEQLTPDQIPLFAKLSAFYKSKGMSDKAANCAKILIAKRGKEAELGEALMSIYPDDKEQFHFLMEHKPGGPSPSPPPSASAALIPSHVSGGARRMESTGSQGHEALLEQQQALQNQILQQKALISQQQQEIAASKGSSRNSPMMPVPSQPPPPASTPAVTVKEPTPQVVPGPSPVAVASSAAPAHAPAPPAQGARGIDVETLVAAGWIPPGNVVTATPFTTPFFPSNTRNRAVSTSPEPNERNFSWAGSDASKQTTFRNQLVQQIKELQEVHQELALHQKSQLELLSQQQVINQQVYPQKGSLQRQVQVQPPQTAVMLPPPPASPVKDETVKRVTALEDEMGRLRALCSQLMGLVQQTYSVANSSAVQLQQQQVQHAYAPKPRALLPAQPMVTPPVPAQQAPVYAAPSGQSVGGYHTYVSKSQTAPAQRTVTPPPAEKRKGFFSNLFHGKKKERSPRGQRTRDRDGRDAAIERFRDRVAHAEELIRQFKKLSKEAEGGSPGLKQDAEVVQGQLAALSRTLREEAKDLHLLPPTPPRKSGYYATSSAASTSSATHRDDYSSAYSYGESSFQSETDSTVEEVPVKKWPRSARRYPSKPAGHR